MTNLPPGKYWVALREDSLGVGWNFLDQHDLGRGQTLELADIQVADPGRLVCHVFDKATGAPLSGQELRLTGDGGLGMGGPTDANGEVAFAAQPGMYRANVNRVEKRVTVESGKSATLRFDVARVTPVPSLDSGFGDPQPALMARAVDELGHPIPYAVVNSFDDPEPMLTDAQGRVDLSRYAPGYRIRLSQGPRTSRAQVLPSKPWPGNEITFTLVPGLLGAVSGSVAFAKGKPISRVVVDLMSAEPWGRVEQSALTDGAGGFTFDGLVPGKLYYLAVHAGSGATESRKFVVRAGTTRKLGSIAIR
ncbi:MAG TPA: carboxypeptidase-like regulatory domain-containing protein [Fimbriimonadaceae bacterium]|nr:carboxypeptidase-like regulatory domain-containing protein [Fimbriimonadaceae bacterium]